MPSVYSFSDFKAVEVNDVKFSVSSFRKKAVDFRNTLFLFSPSNEYSVQSEQTNSSSVCNSINAFDCFSLRVNLISNSINELTSVQGVSGSVIFGTVPFSLIFYSYTKDDSELVYDKEEDSYVDKYNVLGSLVASVSSSFKDKAYLQGNFLANVVGVSYSDTEVNKREAFVAQVKSNKGITRFYVSLNNYFALSNAVESKDYVLINPNEVIEYYEGRKNILVKYFVPYGKTNVKLELPDADEETFLSDELPVSVELVDGKYLLVKYFSDKNEFTIKTESGINYLIKLIPDLSLAKFL